MFDGLTGYTALITGGSSGMGLEMAKQLLSQGATVILAARPGKKLASARDALASRGYDVYAVGMDVTNEESVAGATEWFSANFDRLDMLVNNAGVGRNVPGLEEIAVGSRFYDIPVSAVQTIINTNFLGTFTVTKYFVPMMVARKQGRLLYVSTSTSTMTREGQIPYGPSKAGAEAMMAIMAQELQGTGVTVNVICPGGFTDTPMAGKGDLERMRKNNLPVLRPDVMNRAISFFASSQSDGVHGEKIICREFDEWLSSRGFTGEKTESFLPF